MFLNSDDPHEIVLAVLCKYTRKEAPKIIKQILEKLRAKAPNERNLHEHVTDLEILSGLRNLQSETKKQVDKMPVIYDLRKDLRYKEGADDKARASAIRMLRDGVPIKKIADFLDISLDFIIQIQNDFLKETKSKQAKKTQ